MTPDATNTTKVNIQFSAVPAQDGIRVHASYSIVTPGQNEDDAEKQSFTGGESILVSMDDARAALALSLGAPEANSDELNNETWSKVGGPAFGLLEQAALAMHGADDMISRAAVHLAAAHLITLGMQAQEALKLKGEANATA